MSIPSWHWVARNVDLIKHFFYIVLFIYHKNVGFHEYNKRIPKNYGHTDWTCFSNYRNRRHSKFQNSQLLFNSKNNVIYFATLKDSKKVQEIDQNRNVAFTTIPTNGKEHIKAGGIAVRSKNTVFDLADCFCNKIPDYKNIIEHVGNLLLLYEIHFKTATVTLDSSNIQTITL